MSSLLSNLASSKLVTAITPTSGSIAITGGTGLKFPALTGTDTFNVVLEDAAKNIEVCKVTARAGDVLTVVRGQELTIARTYNIGDRVALRLTAAAFNGKEDIENKDTANGYVGITARKINFKNLLGTFTSFFTNANTSARTYTFQDRDGTILDSVDLTALNLAVSNKAAKGNNGDITQLASPALGAATATTQLTSDNSTKVATTAYVKAAAAQSATVAANAAMPTGTIIDFAANYAPPGFLTLPAVPTNALRSAYPALFTAIGVTWGIGDGTTTFGLPYCPANYASVAADAVNVSSITVGENLAHTHSQLWKSTVGGTLAGGDPNSVGNVQVQTGSSGGAANLAAGIRFRKCVKL